MAVIKRRRSCSTYVRSVKVLNVTCWFAHLKKKDQLRDLRVTGGIIFDSVQETGNEDLDWICLA